MSTTPTPNNSADNNKPAAAPTNGESVTEQFLTEELQQARAGLQRTRLVGIIVAVVVFAYMNFVSAKIVDFLQPKSAASMANGFIEENVTEKTSELAAELKTRIPELIATLPSYVIQQIPEYREKIESRIEDDFTQYAHSTARQLGKHMDDYLDAHVVQIRTLLAASQDSHALKELGPDLEHTILEYLSEKPDEGESIKEKIDKSLEALKRIEAQVDRLAHGKDLTPQEKKARRIVAIVAHTVDDTTKPEGDMSKPLPLPKPAKKDK